MAWSAPRTWVADEIVTAALLNTELRDNLLVLSTHAHTGAAGMGASTLSAVSMTSLATATFADQSGDPSTNGRLQRNGANLLYYDGSSAIDLTASDQSAATASLRTLGTGSTQAAAGNHTHAITATADNFAAGEANHNDDDEHDLVTLSASAASTDNAWAVIGSVDGTDVTSGFVFTYKLYYDGSIVDTKSGIAGGTQQMMFYVKDIATTDAKVIKVTVQRTSGGSGYGTHALVGYQEVEI